VLRLGRYEGDLATACIRIKQPSGARLARALGELWLQRRRDDAALRTIDAVVPVPLHWRRRWRRGYNQAESIALAIGTGLGVPLWRRGLQRRRATTPQTDLPPTSRRLNVHNAFVARSSRRWGGARVLLVDDVLTTGATCHHAARALRAGGVASILVATMARGDHVSAPTSR
jgi:ComF family protein